MIKYLSIELEKKHYRKTHLFKSLVSLYRPPHLVIVFCDLSCSPRFSLLGKRYAKSCSCKPQKAGGGGRGGSHRPHTESFCQFLFAFGQILMIRDGNSSENFIPRGIEESRNDKFTFLGDRGICYLFLGVLGEFRGTSYCKNPENPPKIKKKNFKKKIKKKFQH